VRIENLVGTAAEMTGRTLKDKANHVLTRFHRSRSILDAQPALVRDAFNYCLCLLMAQADKMRLAEKVPGENGVVCVFTMTSGDHFNVVEPRMSKESKAAVIDVLREILAEEGM
jgi:hypothetical protein